MRITWNFFKAVTLMATLMCALCDAQASTPSGGSLANGLGGFNFKPSDFSFSANDLNAQNPNLVTADIPTIVKYYAVMLVLPIVLGIICGIYLCLANVFSCCCSKCCCSPPSCLNSKMPLVISFSVLFAGMMYEQFSRAFSQTAGAAIVSWQSSPKIVTGVDSIFQLVPEALSSFQNYFQNVVDSVSNITSEAVDAFLPAIGANFTNQTNYYNDDVIRTSDNGNNLTDEVQSLFTNLEIIYAYIQANLTALQQAETKPNSSKPYIPPGTVPNPSLVPSPLSTVGPSIIVLKIGFSVVKNQSVAFRDEIANLTALNISGLYNLSSFSFPFANFTSLLPNLTGFDLMNYFGVGSSIGGLNMTMFSSMPIGPAMISQFQNVFDENAKLYTLAITGILAGSALIFALWYIGIFAKINIVMRIPFLLSIVLVIVLGILVGVHLAFGKLVTNNYISYGVNLLKNQSFPPQVQNVTEKFFNDPFKLLECKGTESFFDLYNISILNDFGFSSILDSFNASSFASNLLQPPSTAALDFLLISMEDNNTFVNTTTLTYSNSDQISLSDTEQCEIYLTTYSTTNATEINEINGFLIFVNNLKSLYGDANTTLSAIYDRLQGIKSDINTLKNDRNSIIDTFMNAVTFPFFNSPFLQNSIQKLQNALGQCGWFGHLFDVFFNQALCGNIAPGLLNISFSSATTALAMVALSPIIMWSVNLSSKDKEDDKDVDMDE